MGEVFEEVLVGEQALVQPFVLKWGKARGHCRSKVKSQGFQVEALQTWQFNCGSASFVHCSQLIACHSVPAQLAFAC